jgi:hypothetical protein
MLGNGKAQANGRPLTYERYREYLEGKLSPNAATCTPPTEEQD